MDREILDDITTRLSRCMDLLRQGEQAQRGDTDRTPRGRTSQEVPAETMKRLLAAREA